MNRLGIARRCLKRAAVPASKAAVEEGQVKAAAQGRDVLDASGSTRPGAATDQGVVEAIRMAAQLKDAAVCRSEMRMAHSRCHGYQCDQRSVARDHEGARPLTASSVATAAALAEPRGNGKAEGGATARTAAKTTAATTG